MGRRHRKRHVHAVVDTEPRMHIQLHMHSDTYKWYEQRQAEVKFLMAIVYAEKGDAKNFERAWRGRVIILHQRESRRCLLQSDLLRNIQYKMVYGSVHWFRRPYISIRRDIVDLPPLALPQA